MTFGLSAVAFGGLVAGAGAVGGALISGSAAKSAANTQASAANNAAQIQQNQWDQTQANLSPYMNLGRSSINPLITALGYNATQDANGQYQFTRDASNPLQQTFNAPTSQEAQQTPGYQFTMDQGLKSVQNSAAARGLGTSGAALKGAAGYATGLADSTYNDVYQRALNTFNTNYSSASNNANRMQGLVSNGQNSAATNGSLGAAATGAIGNTLTSGANAIASGTVGSANALSSALSSTGNNAMLYGLMQNNASNSSAANYQAAANSGSQLGGTAGFNFTE